MIRYTKILTMMMPMLGIFITLAKTIEKAIIFLPPALNYAGDCMSV
jgi:hypothetical protein